LRIGDYPFCGSPGGHGSILPEFAQHFDPIIVHVSANGEYRFPAATDAPVPAGFEKREIRSLREADAVTREVNRREDGRLESVFNASESSRLEKRKRNREFMDAMRHKLSPAARRYLDEYREYQQEKDKERAQSRPRSADFHMEVFAMDASNREAYADSRTDWRRRKA
jgi:hypothetical protein